jgi:hypothetical protein
MALHQGLTPEDATGSIEVKEADQDVEMKDRSGSAQDDADVDADGDAADDGDHDMFRAIQQLSTHLSTVEEE